MVLVGLACTVTASTAADMWLNIGGISKHLNAGDRQFNEVNNGFGIEVEAKGITGSTGVYRNSVGTESRYAAVEKLIFTRGQIGAGVSIGVVDGYPYRNGGLFPTVLPVVRWDGDTVGIRALLIPPIDDRVTAAVALQFRIRIK